MEPFNVFNQVSVYFSRLGEHCFAVKLQWTTKLQPTFHQHEGERIMTEFSCLGELCL